MDVDRVYQRIGEFVVCFQFIEEQLRNIGWIILDPNRNDRPPKHFDGFTNEKLLKKVESLFVEYISTLDILDGDNRKRDFRAIVQECHLSRRYRNQLLHSAYFELKGGDEVFELLQVDSKPTIDPTSGKSTSNPAILSEEFIVKHIQVLGKLSFLLGAIYRQLILWAPRSP